MKILKYSLFCCMLGIVSCSTNSNSKQLDKISNLKGEWLISSSFGAMCNVCPELVFFDSSRGSIEKPSKESYDFKYEINKDKISFKFEEGQEYIDLDSEFSYNVKSDSILRYQLSKRRNVYPLKYTTGWKTTIKPNDGGPFKD